MPDGVLRDLGQDMPVPMPHRGSLRFGFSNLSAQRRRAIHAVDCLNQAALVDDSNGHRDLQRLRMQLCCVDYLPRLLSGDPHRQRSLRFAARRRLNVPAECAG